MTRWPLLLLLVTLVLAACRTTEAPPPPGPPSLHVRQYLGVDDDALAIPTPDWLLGPWVVDVNSIELHGDEEDPRPLLDKLYRSVLILEQDFYRFQEFVEPYEVHAAGKLEIGAVDENGEVALTFHVAGEAPQTDHANRWGLTLFLAPRFAWHVWHRPSSRSDWVSERMGLLKDARDAWEARQRNGVHELPD